MEDSVIHSPNTHYAPADRTAQSEIQSEFSLLSSDDYFQMFFEAMPDVAAVVNENRQIVFANQALVALAGRGGLAETIGLRAGELLECKNLKQNSNGCGTTRACTFCGIVNTVLDAHKTGNPAVYVSRITSGRINHGQSIDVEVKSSPISLNGKKFTILSIRDISDKKRRMILENMFFHDMLDTATGLKRTILALEDFEGPDGMKQSIESAKKACGELVDEILAQRMLVSAESDELIPEISRFNSRQLLQEVLVYLDDQAIAVEKKIYIDPFSHNLYFETDPDIFKRVLINVAKNAIEASKPGETIQMGCRISDDYLIFWVNNPGLISESIQDQLFQHSFSTKGENRGIGTYAIKLLTTRYLGGNVTFESDSEKGTTFYIHVPFSLTKT